MKIGIYKPVKKVFFYDNVEDHAGWSIEVVNIAKIIAQYHDVYIISPTDYVEGSLPNIYLGKELYYDRIFMFNSLTISAEEIKQVKVMTNRLDLLVTDLNLMPHNIELFDNIYTQSDKLFTYGYLEENYLFKAKFLDKSKTIDYYFGGTERKRLVDILEYVYRPNCIWKGKSAFLGKLDYVSFAEHSALMSQSKYSVVIGDETYNQCGFVTPRYYECLLAGVLPFVDTKYDPDELIISNGNFLRVSSYQELMIKMKACNDDDGFRQYLLQHAIKQITHEQLTGKNIYRALFKQ